MKELLRKVAIALPGIALLGGVAFADVGNNQTGFESENNASLEMEDEIEVDLDNHADIWNDIFAKADTGDNDANENTGSGSVSTGDASTSVAVTNKANATTLAVSGAFGDIDDDIDVTNSVTGANSVNNAWVELEREVELDIDNHTNVRNCITATADTGDNSASRNTGNGSVTTGDASTSVTIENSLNANDISVK